MKVLKEATILSFSSPKDFEKWIKKNYLLTEGIWIKFAKKNSAIASISPQEALEFALCYGWIDGQRKTFDDKYFLNKYTPRRKGSLWSKRNCVIANLLIKDKRMKPSGMKEIEAAKTDGRWERAYDSAKNMTIPPDFLDRVKKSKKGFKFFKSLNKTNMFAIGFRLQTAKKPETREKRMKAILEMMDQGKSFH